MQVQVSEELLVRRGQAGDAAFAQALLQQHDWGQACFGDTDADTVARLLEHAHVSVTCVDAYSGDPVGLMVFHDSPLGGAAALQMLPPSSWEHSLRQLCPSLPFQTEDTLFLSLWVASQPESQLHEMATSAVASVFETLPCVDQILFAVPGDCASAAVPADLELLFNEVARIPIPMGQAEEEEEGEPGSGEGGGDGESVQVEDGGVGREGGEGDADTAPPELVLFRCHRSAVVPKLTLRRGYVEDYDDLLPLLNQDQPVVGPPKDQLYLARLLEGQNDRNFVLAALHGDDFVGILALSGDVDDFDNICESFDLSPYDEFCPKKFSGISEEDQRRVRSTDGRRNVFRITLFCMLEGFESRGVDFLKAAYDLFQSRNYCLLTLPYTSGEFPLLKEFTRVQTLPGSLYGNCLFVHHRYALYKPLSLEIASPEDLPTIQALLEDVENIEESLKAIEEVLMRSGAAENSQKKCFVCRCQGQIIGAAVVHPTTSFREWSKRYDLAKFVNTASYADEDSCVLQLLVLLPIFYNRMRFFVKEIMRKLSTSIIFYEWDINAKILHVSQEMITMAPRRQILFPKPADCALDDHNESSAVGYFSSKRYLSEEKVSSHSRIVVVGASDTALTFIHHLLMIPDTNFTGITILAPEGLPRYPSLKEESFFPNSYPFLPQEYNIFRDGSRMMVVKDKMEKLDREKKRVILQKGGSIAYDFLVLATGRQFTFSPRFLRMLINKGSTLPDLGVYNLVRGSQLRSFKEFVKQEWPRLRNNVVVYGATLAALCSVEAILKLGVDPSKVVLVLPPFARGSLMMDPLVEEKLFERLNSLGVRVLQNFSLCDFESNDLREVTASIFEEDELQEGPRWEEPGKVEEERPKVSVPCCAFLQCDTQDVDQDILRAATQSSIVFDGRLVVDPEFKTADPTIFASGPLVRFSRQFGPSQFLELYNAREVGLKLARVLLPIFDPEAMLDEEDESKRSAFSSIPVFDTPKSIYCRLPGNNVFFHMGSLGLLHGSIQCKKRYTECGGDRYMAVYISSGGLIEGITYFGTNEVEVWNLQCLVGLPEKYVNNLADQFDEGVIPDLLSFLREDWVFALYHDRFSRLRQNMVTQLNHQSDIQALRKKAEQLLQNRIDELSKSEKEDVMGSVTRETSMLIQQLLVEFLKENHQDFDQYLIPGFVE